MEGGKAAAHTCGLLPAGVVALTGEEWNALSEDDQIALAPAVGVFAEATPLDKSSFIRALEASGEIVGACANCQEDYLVAHAAHLVFGTQQQGQQGIRAHADIVCLDDSFSSVVAAVIRGRRFRANFNSYLEFRFTLVCACACSCACILYILYYYTHTHTHIHTYTHIDACDTPAQSRHGRRRRGFNASKPAYLAQNTRRHWRRVGAGGGHIQVSMCLVQLTTTIEHVFSSTNYC